MVISQDEVADKLAIIQTMFLTAVAFQFVLQQDLPNKPYSTWIDRYIVSESNGAQLSEFY